MSDDMPALTDQEVLRHAQDLLEEHLPWHGEGSIVFGTTFVRGFSFSYIARL